MHCRTALVVALIAFVAAVPSASAQTADDIIAKNVEAKGGLERLRAVKTVKQESQLTINGQQSSVLVYAKRPNMLRQEILVNGQTIINGFDGKTPWVVNPLSGMKGPMVVSGAQADEIRDQSDFDGPLVDYKVKGYRAEFVGTETVQGRSLHHLRLTAKNQHVLHAYLDVLTNLEVRLVSEASAAPGAAMVQLEQELFNFREVDGIKVPFAIRTIVGGRVQTQIAVTHVEFNVPIDDALFKLPK